MVNRSVPPEAGGDAARLPALAAALVHSGVEVIVAAGPEPPLKAAAAATSAIPIVMVAMNFDPVQRGYVKNLARPGGNITGMFSLVPDLAAKQLQLLAEADPGARRVGILWDQLVATQVWDQLVATQVAVAKRAGKSQGIELSAVELRHPPYDFRQAFRTLAETRVEAVLVLSSPLFRPLRRSIALLAQERRLPTMFTFPEYARAGGLISYGPDLQSLFRGAASYIDRILKGAKPTDLPIEQPTKFVMAVNLRIAKALGRDLPPFIVAHAGEVIQ
ncbi:MAG: ABC transporter substrate-binding protein [Stellaceae bacterium]